MARGLCGSVSVAWIVLALAGCTSAPVAPAPERGARATDERPAHEFREGGNDRGFEPNAGEARGSRPRGPHNRAATASQAGDFDFYLLNLSWSPEFCATHAGSPECGAHPGFVVHGLWPQNTDGTYPENCSHAPGPGNPGSLTDLIPTVSLVEHEWTTHGTCSGLGADAYFAQVRRAFQEIRIPARFTAAAQQETMLSPETILSEFGAANAGFPAQSFALSCGNNYLTAIEVCMDRNLHPEGCQGVRSCRANMVKITPR